MTGIIDVVVVVGLLIISVVLHENAHGYVALWLGDRTAQLNGRLTLNPLRHLDPFGSVILPAVLALASGTAFGYAKPVPVNRYALRGKDRGFAIVALAGPVSNFVLAYLTVVVLRGLGSGVVSPLMSCSQLGPGDMVTCYAGRFALLNIYLAAFNLIPIPPLDGSRLLRLVLRPRGIAVLDRIEPYGFLILFAIIFLAREPFDRLITWIAVGLLRLLPL